MVLARWSSSRPATACMRRWPCWRRCSANEPRPADPGLLAPAPGGGPPHRSGRSGRRGRCDLHPLPAAAAPARDAGHPDPGRPDPARGGRHRFDDLQPHPPFLAVPQRDLLHRHRGHRHVPTRAAAGVRPAWPDEPHRPAPVPLQHAPVQPGDQRGDSRSRADEHETDRSVDRVRARGGAGGLRRDRRAHKRRDLSSDAAVDLLSELAPARRRGHRAGQPHHRGGLPSASARGGQRPGTARDAPSGRPWALAGVGRARPRSLGRDRKHLSDRRGKDQPQPRPGQLAPEGGRQSRLRQRQWHLQVPPMNWTLVTNEWRLKLLAVGLAILMLGTLAFSQNQPTTSHIDVGLNYTVPPNIILINPPAKTTVYYSGLAAVISRVNDSNLIASVDATRALPGSAVKLNVTAKSLISDVLVQNPP